MKKISNENYNTGIINKNLFFLGLAVTAGIGIFIFSLLKLIQDTQKINIDPFPDKANVKEKINVKIVNSNLEESSFKVEIADEEGERRKGLMFREDLQDDEGMLFIFPSERPLSFWMKNTPSSLDMLFFDKNMNLITYYENTLPNNDTIFYSSIKPAMYVLELKGGAITKNNITKDSQLHF